MTTRGLLKMQIWIYTSSSLRIASVPHLHYPAKSALRTLFGFYCFPNDHTRPMYHATNFPKTWRTCTFFVVPDWSYRRIAVSNPRSAIVIAPPAREDHRDSTVLNGVPSADLISRFKQKLISSSRRLGCKVVGSLKVANKCKKCRSPWHLRFHTPQITKNNQCDRWRKTLYTSMEKSTIPSLIL